MENKYKLLETIADALGRAGIEAYIEGTSPETFADLQPGDDYETQCAYPAYLITRVCGNFYTIPVKEVNLLIL